MRFYFTKSNLAGSKFIRWGLGEDCSHFAMGFDLPGFSQPQVVESRLDKGVFAHNLTGLLELNTIVHELRLREPDPSFEEKLFQSMMKHAVGRKYDAKAFYFWIAAGFVKRAFGSKLPHKNPWGTKRDHLCVEIIRGSELVLEEGLGMSLKGIDFEMTSPYGLLQILASSPRLVFS